MMWFCLSDAEYVWKVWGGGELIRGVRRGQDAEGMFDG